MSNDLGTSGSTPGPALAGRAPARVSVQAGRSAYWSELWRFRELMLLLTWRDILVRYKQTAIGVAWAVLRPLVTMLVFVLIFGRIARFPSHGVPYALLVFAAMLPWQFFSSAFSEAGNSLVINAHIVAKVYFPRALVPMSAVLVSLVDFAISFVLLLVLLLWYGHVPGLRMLMVLPYLGLALLAALGAGFWIAAANVQYRDFRVVVPVVVQLGLYLSPVAYSSSVVPDQWRLLYALNPMVAVIDGFRWALLGDAFPIHWPSQGVGLAVIAVMLATGLTYFRRVERVVADVI